MSYVLNARKKLGMTQVELADALGTTQPNISRIENEPDALDKKTKLAIEALLNRKAKADAK